MKKPSKATARTPKPPPPLPPAKPPFNAKSFFLNDLVLLRHKFIRTRRAVEARQHGHRGKRLTRASMMRRRTVAIEFGT